MLSRPELPNPSTYERYQQWATIWWKRVLAAALEPTLLPGQTPETGTPETGNQGLHQRLFRLTPRFMACDIVRSGAGMNETLPHHFSAHYHLVLGWSTMFRHKSETYVLPTQLVHLAAVALFASLVFNFISIFLECDVPRFFRM
jgi:hypothetical protein